MDTCTLSGCLHNECKRDRRKAAIAAYYWLLCGSRSGMSPPRGLVNHWTPGLQAGFDRFFGLRRFAAPTL
jgi:hypothetical protein